MKNTGFSIGSIIGLSLAVILFWIFAFNIWFSNTILNQENFVNTTTQVITTEESRNAIASEVVEITQENFPIIGSVTAPLIQKVVVGILDTELFTTIFEKLSEEIYFQLTNPNPKPLEINIGGAISLIEPFLDDQDTELFANIPNKITLIGENEIPNISQFANTLAIIGPISLIAGLILIGLIWRMITNKRNYFIAVGLISAASGFLVFSLIPVIGNYIASGVTSANGLYIINELYAAFTQKLVDLSLAVLVIGLFTALIAKYVKRSALRLPQKPSK